jgi:hypothetical protein
LSPFPRAARLLDHCIVPSDWDRHLIVDASETPTVLHDYAVAVTSYLPFNRLWRLLEERLSYDERAAYLRWLDDEAIHCGARSA